MRETILQELANIELECGVRILLCVESGSRAWGMASADSDYDVRFVYAGRLTDYLRLEKTSDTIEWKLDEVLDISGWDVAKFLRLVRNSNPTAFEWLSSPIKYFEAEDFAPLRDVAAGCFSPRASSFHYLGIAHSHRRRPDQECARIKKYLYAIRALLAARWCLEEQSPVPMLLTDLVESKLPREMRQTVAELLEMKMADKERSEVAAIPMLDEWIERENRDLHAMAQAAESPAKLPWEDLDKAFAELVLDGQPS